MCIEGFNNGNPNNLLSPVDFDGKLCGVDYPEHPYLYFLVRLEGLPSNTDFTYRAICLKECPLSNTTEPLDCKLITELNAANCAARMDLETGQPTTGYVGYGTKPLFSKFCVPNLNELP